ncbi:MAG TPA: HlyD family efflux transporter periplasmic adaptor subunit [Puia sp.]|jgi:multidrug efflux pump subunit AcrA (membrane-fusion protein)|nr:HlyD family efflux transporter periplasmic adaptor subunit [Puia sp.]
MKSYLLLLAACGLFACSLFACGSRSASGKNEAAAAKDSATAGAAADTAKAADAGDSVDARTPVTVTTVSNSALNDSIELNAVSTFLQKSYVKANANGYLQSADVYPGKYVEVGQPLFTLKTKEAQSIGNAIGQLDSTLKFSGVNNIKANQHGYITQLDHQSGDYVQDGEQLAVISDRNSFVFLLSLPYELRPAVLGKKTATLLLPDGTRLQGSIGPLMPTVDSASQTQNVVIRVNTAAAIPENLIAKVRILRTARPGAQSLPKSALLTDETESDFWVMKLIDSATAVKVPVKKGIETADRVEVLFPKFSPDDKILTTGNYGLPDTAKVKVEPNN